MEKATADVKNMMQDQEDQIKKLKRVKQTKTFRIQALEIQLERLQQVKEKFELKYTKVKKQLAGANARIYTLHDENGELQNDYDKVRGELQRIREKYDFEVIDLTKAALTRYVTWSVKMIKVAPRVNSVFDQFFKCGICNSSATNPVIVEPCNHIFCKECFANQGFHERCRSCGTIKEKVYQSDLVTNFVDAYVEVLISFNTMRKSYKECQGNPNERMNEEFANFTQQPNTNAEQAYFRDDDGDDTEFSATAEEMKENMKYLKTVPLSKNSWLGKLNEDQPAEEEKVAAAAPADEAKLQEWEEAQQIEIDEGSLLSPLSVSDSNEGTSYRKPMRKLGILDLN